MEIKKLHDGNLNSGIVFEINQSPWLQWAWPSSSGPGDLLISVKLVRRGTVEGSAVNQDVCQVFMGLR